MYDKPFPSPVTLRIDGKKLYRISTPWEAVEYLKNQWPGLEGALYRRALQLCLDAVDGLQSVSKAHKAFVGAVMEAGIIAEHS